MMWTEEDLKAHYDRLRQPVPVAAAAPPKAKARAAKPKTPRAMNKVEQAYAQYLEAQQEAGRIQSYRYEAVTVKLGPDCRYTPDFMVIENDGLIAFHETKGVRGGKVHYEDDAIVKLRMACDKFSEFRWVLVWRESNGAWAQKEMTP